jgi:hypothetical protein
VITLLLLLAVAAVLVWISAGAYPIILSGLGAGLAWRRKAARPQGRNGP